MAWQLIPKGQYAPLRQTVANGEDTPIGDVSFDLAMNGTLVMGVDGRYFDLSARALNGFIEFYKVEGKAMIETENE